MLKYTRRNQIFHSEELLKILFACFPNLWFLFLLISKIPRAFFFVKL